MTAHCILPVRGESVAVAEFTGALPPGLTDIPADKVQKIIKF